MWHSFRTKRLPTHICISVCECLYAVKTAAMQAAGSFTFPLTHSYVESDNNKNNISMFYVCVHIHLNHCMVLNFPFVTSCHANAPSTASNLADLLTFCSHLIHFLPFALLSHKLWLTVDDGEILLLASIILHRFHINTHIRTYCRWTVILLFSNAITPLLTHFFHFEIGRLRWFFLFF